MVITEKLSWVLSSVKSFPNNRSINHAVKLDVEMRRVRRRVAGSAGVSDNLSGFHFVTLFYRVCI